VPAIPPAEPGTVPARTVGIVLKGVPDDAAPAGESKPLEFPAAPVSNDLHDLK
jgi:hypothetical protein